MSPRAQRFHALAVVLTYLMVLFPVGWGLQLWALQAGAAADSPRGLLALVGTPALAAWLCRVSFLGLVPDPGLRRPSLEHATSAFFFPIVMGMLILIPAISGAGLEPGLPPDALRFGWIAYFGSHLAFTLLVGLPLALAYEWGWRGTLLPALILAEIPSARMTAAALEALWGFPLLVVTCARTAPFPELVPRTVFLILLARALLLGRERLVTGSLWPPALCLASWECLMHRALPELAAPGPDVPLLMGPAGVLTMVFVGLVALWLTAATPDDGGAAAEAPALAVP